VPPRALASHVFRVLVFAGSQGSKSINSEVAKMLHEHFSELEGFEFVHQTGSGDWRRVQELYQDVPATERIQVREYLHDMGQQYADADLVICRSGTGTLSELAAAGCASVLIPFPFAADDHQTKNAEI
jgi:UDP-N-acetylglucosamine--N-acetylmuramyl-(pentapeptide) pyrophosphoryl-undecaprenol N-acetylglucosamine transferase